LIPVNTVGRPREVNMREVLNTIFYLNRSGCQWDMIPHDLLPKSTVHDYYLQWRSDGTWQEILDALRQKVRVAAGVTVQSPVVISSFGAGWPDR
jgi:transposase